MASSHGKGEILYRRLCYSDSEHKDPKEDNGSDFILENSREILDVATMEYPEVIKLMQYVNLKIEAMGPQDRQRLGEYLYSKDGKGSHEHRMQETVNKAMNKYKTRKEKLLEMYINIQKIAMTDPLKTKIIQYMKTFQETMEQFKTDDIEICIFGWTCAGKSTFFNILLGEDIMQTDCLPNTPCLVRLHNSQTRKIEFVDKENSLKTVPLTADQKDAKSKLKSILDQFSGSDTSLGAVKLYWPIPMVHKNVVFVDVPGIGDSNAMTEQVMKHVPKAAGHICIINSGDGGGIPEIGIAKLFGRIKKIAKREGKTNENLGNVLCVCNKWDLVKMNDRQTVLEYTRKRLDTYLGVLNDWQIIPFSAYVELQLLQLRARPTNEFVKILEGLERLVSGTTEKRLLDLFRCINDLKQRSVDIIDEECIAQTKKIDKLLDEKTKKEEELKNAEEKIEKGSKAVERLIDKKKSELIKDLQDYLHSSKVLGEVCNWEKDTPTETDCETKAIYLVKNRITALITKWAEKEDGLLKKARSDTEKECSQQEAKIAAYFASTKDIKIDDCRTRDVKITTKELIIGISVLESVVGIVGTLGIGFTLSALVATGFGIVLTPVAIVLNYGIYRYRLHSKIVSEMTRLSQEVMADVSSDNKTNTLISTLFECPFKKWIDEFKVNMKKKIKSIEEDLEKLKGHIQSERKILSSWKSLQKKFIRCSTRLSKIGDDLKQ